MPTTELSFWQSLTMVWPKTSCQAGGAPGLAGGVAPVSGVIRAQAVEFLRELDRRLVSLALRGQDVDDDRHGAMFGEFE